MINFGRASVVLKTLCVVAGLGSGSSSNFTDYAGAQIGPADVLRGSTSSPIHVRNSYRIVYPEEHATKTDAEASEVQGGHLLSPRPKRSAQLMTRSRSLALPDNPVVEASSRSSSNQNLYKGGDIASHSQRQLSLKAISDDSAASAMLRGQLQQQQLLPKGDKAVQKRRITKDQDIEPSKAIWAGLSALKEAGFVDSPRGGSGYIKVGFEEDGRNGC